MPCVSWPRTSPSRATRAATSRPSSPRGWSRRRSRSSPRTCTATSSTTRSTRARPRSSSAASGCSPTCSPPRARRPGHAPRARPRRSCSAACPSSGTGAPVDRPRAAPPNARTSSSAATCTSSGRSSAATSTSSRASSPSNRGSTRSGRRTWRRTWTRTPSGSRPCSARPSRGTRTTSSASTTCSCRSSRSVASTCPCASTGPARGFVWPFLYPDSPWDFRLEQVRSINVSGHKFGLVYPGIGWLVFREVADLAPDLVFTENYLGKTDATFTLNFSTGSAMVLAQYYNLVRYGREGYTYIMRNMQENARALADKLEAMGRFEIIGRDQEQLPLVAFRLAADEVYNEFDIAWQLSAERGWMVPAYTLPPDAQDVTIMRALVKETMSREHVDTLARDIEEACATLARKGGAHPSERAKIVTGPGH